MIQRGQRVKQKKADLHEERVLHEKAPFIDVGIDFFFFFFKDMDRFSLVQPAILYT